MNILHHKSWHVRTKKNIERVRKDEEKAADEEKEKLRRIALAEQEARTDVLRSRAQGRITDRESDRLESGPSDNNIVQTTDGVQQPERHINFFQDIEDGLCKQGINEEHQKEKRAEKEKWEKSVGLLTYLGKSNIDAQNETPWYVSGMKRKHEELEEKEDLKIDKEYKKQCNLDPLNKMKEFLEKKKKKGKPKDHKDKQRKKQKEKERHREKEKCKSLAKPSTSKTIEQLRSERLKREQREKHRASELFAKLKEGSSESEEEVHDRSRKYNSQYNPELCRKYKKRSHDDYR